MNAITSYFEALGMTPLQAASREALFEQLDRRAGPILDGPATWRRFTPGRIEIFGKHTDYAGGHSLLAAVPRGIALVARPRQDGIVRVGDIFDGQVIEVDPVTAAPPHYRGIQRYVHVVAHRLAVNFPGCDLGANIAIASDLPRASGLSSSSALTVGVALALIKRANLRERPEWQAHLRRVYDLGWYLGCVENGLDFPGLPGSAGVGTHGGSEDQTAILACKTEHVSLYRFVPVTPLGDTRMPDDWTFVIASSGVQADKADSVKDRYNRASNGVRALHALWDAHSGHRAQSLCAALASHPHAAEKLEKWIDADAAGRGRFTADELRQRLRHFVRETARPPQAATAFREANTHLLGALSAESQREAHELLGNQIPETMLLASLAREAGAFASSSFGAGFGGSVWAAVRTADAEGFGAEWVRAFESRMPHVGKVDWFVARPGPAATEIPL
jgi:galactokinase